MGITAFPEVVISGIVGGEKPQRTRGRRTFGVWNETEDKRSFRVVNDSPVCLFEFNVIQELHYELVAWFAVYT